MADLHDAALKNDVAAINRLLRQGADIQEGDNNGWTPLHCAAQANAIRAAVTLLDRGAHVDAVDRFGGTALVRAVFEQHVEMVTLLREHGADPLLGAAQLARLRGGPVKACFDDLPAEVPVYEYQPATVTRSGRIPAGPVGERWQHAHARLWKLLVPASGAAPTLQGELIRCTGRLADEALRNGNVNWGPAFSAMAELVERTLCDETVLGDVDIGRARAASRQVRGGGVPVLGDPGGPYDTLAELAVAWCAARAELIAYPSPDPASAR
ncbi:MAG: ankyrin repeat domain-containing protein [Kofleriaceae bacterium]|nr:ankyrin repeat domain-containing protein [Kofleriaceae bacterium]